MNLKNNYLKLNDFIKFMVETQCENDNFCIYGREGELNGDREYFISDYPRIDVNSNEVYPHEVISSGLSYIYSGEQFTDVIISVMEQKTSASNKDYIDALNYYLDNDDFLDLQH